MLDTTVMKRTNLNDTLCNPFGTRDYIIYIGNKFTIPDAERTWLSECCGHEPYLPPDISVWGVTGFCRKCEDNVGFISEEEYYL